MGNAIAMHEGREQPKSREHHASAAVALTRWGLLWATRPPNLGFRLPTTLFFHRSLPAPCNYFEVQPQPTQHREAHWS